MIATNIPDESSNMKTDDKWQGVNKHSGILKFYHRHMISYDYMLRFPSDCIGNFAIMSKPFGARCLLYTGKGKTYLRDRRGVVLRCFESLLPNGSELTKAANNVMLQCMYNETSLTAYLVDVLKWEDTDLIASPFEMRWSWMITKIQSLDKVTEIGMCNNIRLRYNANIYSFNPKKFDLLYNCKNILEMSSHKDLVVSHYDVDQKNELFLRDGLLIINLEGPYIMGISPFYLQWKDDRCSAQYNKEMIDGKTNYIAKLLLTKLNELITEDNVTLCSLSPEEASINNYIYGKVYVVSFDFIDSVNMKLVNPKILKKSQSYAISTWAQIMFFNKERKLYSYETLQAELIYLKNDAQKEINEEIMES